ncbi:MAG TPA: TraR/DksA C4-type zinc finger protein [Chloroflexota bacterium]|nr:TraR/DksA C4-type zinc finger protein [Chloroflexota bacterium]
MSERTVTPRLQQELAQALVRERARLLRTAGQLATAERELGESQGSEGDGRGAPADLASDLVEATVDLALEHAERERLAAVEAALHRIAEGTYGTCEGCGEPINTDRLYAHPWANLCIRCAQRAAGGASSRGRPG